MLNAINETHNLFHIAEPDVSRGVSQSEEDMLKWPL